MNERGNAPGAAAPLHAEDEKIAEPAHLTVVPTNLTDVSKEKVEIPRDQLVASLGIPDWEVKEKQVVRRLDMTLLPQLWILYMFNYLNRTNIA